MSSKPAKAMAALSARRKLEIQGGLPLPEITDGAGEQFRHGLEGVCRD